MEIRIGPPVTGPNFYPRRPVIDRLRRSLARGSVSFMAPRRTGKTSILLHLEEESDEDHPHCRINLETCTTPAQWIEALCQAFDHHKPRWKKAWGAVAEALGRLEGVEVSGVGSVKISPRNWRKPAETFLDVVRAQGRPMTFLLDEFPILVNEAAKADVSECREMLRWFRQWRHDAAEDSIRFLVTGSIGLDNVVRRHGLWDTVNDFDTVDLPPLSHEDGRQMLQNLGADNGVPLDDALAEHALRLLGVAWPYFLQIFVAELQDRDGDGPGPLGPADLDAVYRERLVAGPRNKYLEHMWNRLGEVFDRGERKVARALLHGLCDAENGLTRSDLETLGRASLSDEEAVDETRVPYVLDVLTHDGYLAEQAERIETTAGSSRDRFRLVFFSNLLRDYWRRRRT